MRTGETDRKGLCLLGNMVTSSLAMERAVVTCWDQIGLALSYNLHRRNPHRSPLSGGLMTMLDLGLFFSHCRQHLRLPSLKPSQCPPWSGGVVSLLWSTLVSIPQASFFQLDLPTPVGGLSGMAKGILLLTRVLGLEPRLARQTRSASTGQLKRQH